MENVLAVVNAPTAVLTDFDPIEAITLGVLGDKEAYATDSGMESVACCNSVVATG